MTKVLIAEYEIPRGISKTRILIVKPVPPLSTSVDLENIESIELRTADDRHIRAYYLKVDVEVLRELYDKVERTLSFALQKPTTLATQRVAVDDVRMARDNLRAVMRKMGWKQHF